MEKEPLAGKSVEQNEKALKDNPLVKLMNGALKPYQTQAQLVRELLARYTQESDSKKQGMSGGKASLDKFGPGMTLEDEVRTTVESYLQREWGTSDINAVDNRAQAVQGLATELHEFMNRVAPEYTGKEFETLKTIALFYKKFSEGLSDAMANPEKMKTDPVSRALRSAEDFYEDAKYKVVSKTEEAVDKLKDKLDI